MCRLTWYRFRHLESKQGMQFQWIFNSQASWLGILSIRAGVNVGSARSICVVSTTLKQSLILRTPFSKDLGDLRWNNRANGLIKLPLASRVHSMMLVFRVTKKGTCVLKKQRNEIIALNTARAWRSCSFDWIDSTIEPQDRASTSSEEWWCYAIPPSSAINVVVFVA